MKEQIINDAIQYIQDNHLEKVVYVLTKKIIVDTGVTDVLNVATIACVSIYIIDKYVD